MQSFTGVYSEMVEKIFRGENYLNCDKQLKLEDTVGGFSFVVANKRATFDELSIQLFKDHYLDLKLIILYIL